MIHVAFQVMIFAALLESGTGAVHAVNQRLAGSFGGGDKKLSWPIRLDDFNPASDDLGVPSGAVWTCGSYRQRIPVFVLRLPSDLRSAAADSWDLALTSPRRPSCFTRCGSVTAGAEAVKIGRRR